MSIFTDDRTFLQPINRFTTFFMVLFHIGAVAALFMFSWKALTLALVLWWVAGSLGIGIGYHRLLTHRSYRTPKWVEYVLTICGTLALEGGPMFWVAVHRLHHQNTDQESDPHSPRDGGLWAHMGWIMTGQAMHSGSAELLPYVPRPSQRQVPNLDQPMALDPNHNPRPDFAFCWWLAICDVGHLSPDSHRSPHHLARELCHAYVGIAAFSHGRCFQE